MISKFLEHLLVVASISPIFLAIWVSEFTRTGNPAEGMFWLLLFLVSTLISLVVIKFSEKKLEALPIRIRSVAPANGEMTTFLVAYMLPLLGFANLNLWSILFIVGLLYAYTLISGKYYFNPILSLLCGYRYFKVEVDYNNGDKTYHVLMTKRSLRNAKNVRKVVQISDHILLEAHTWGK